MVATLVTQEFIQRLLPQFTSFVRSSEKKTQEFIQTFVSMLKLLVVFWGFYLSLKPLEKPFVRLFFGHRPGVPA